MSYCINNKLSNTITPFIYTISIILYHQHILHTLPTTNRHYNYIPYQSYCIINTFYTHCQPQTDLATIYLINHTVSTTHSTHIVNHKQTLQLYTLSIILYQQHILHTSPTTNRPYNYIPYQSYCINNTFYTHHQPQTDLTTIYLINHTVSSTHSTHIANHKQTLQLYTLSIILYHQHILHTLPTTNRPSNYIPYQSYCINNTFYTHRQPQTDLTTIYAINHTVSTTHSTHIINHKQTLQPYTLSIILYHQHILHTSPTTNRPYNYIPYQSYCIINTFYTHHQPQTDLTTIYLINHTVSSTHSTHIINHKQTLQLYTLSIILYQQHILHTSSTTNRPYNHIPYQSYCIINTFYTHRQPQTDLTTIYLINHTVSSTHSTHIINHKQT